MRTILGIALIAIFGFLALIHVYWAFGGRFARVAEIPELRGAPSSSRGRLTTLLVACCLMACAALVGMATGFIDSPVPAPVIQRTCFGLAMLLLVRAIGDFRLMGFFKTVRHSRYAWLDSALYSPLSLAMSVGVLIVAWEAGA